MRKILTFVLIFLYSLNSKAQTPKLLRWIDKHSQKEVKRYFKYDTTVTTSNAFIHLNYNNVKNKPYLLLLHGMGSNGRNNWMKQIKSLSKDFNLILPDLIYFGESKSNSNNFSVEFQCEQLHECLLKLGINNPINVMGFSYGGLTAAMYNELYQTEIKKLIIVDGPVKFFSIESANDKAIEYGSKNINDLLVPTTIKDFNSLKKAAMASNFPLPKKLKQQIINHLFIPFREIRNKQISFLADNQNKYQNLNYNLDKTPTLLIWGKQDGVIPISVGEKLQQQFPNTTQLIVFKKAKHDAQFRYKRRFNKNVKQFLK